MILREFLLSRLLPIRSIVTIHGGPFGYDFHVSAQTRPEDALFTTTIRLRPGGSAVIRHIPTEAQLAIDDEGAEGVYVQYRRPDGVVLKHSHDPSKPVSYNVGGKDIKITQSE